MMEQAPKWDPYRQQYESDREKAEFHLMQTPYIVVVKDMLRRLAELEKRA